MRQGESVLRKRGPGQANGVIHGAPSRATAVFRLSATSPLITTAFILSRPSKSYLQPTLVSRVVSKEPPGFYLPISILCKRSFTLIHAIEVVGKEWMVGPLKNHSPPSLHVLQALYGKPPAPIQLDLEFMKTLNTKKGFLRFIQRLMRFLGLKFSRPPPWFYPLKLSITLVPVDHSPLRQGGCDAKIAFGFAHF